MAQVTEEEMAMLQLYVKQAQKRYKKKVWQRKGQHYTENVPYTEQTVVGKDAYTLIMFTSIDGNLKYTVYKGKAADVLPKQKALQSLTLN